MFFKKVNSALGKRRKSFYWIKCDKQASSTGA